MVRPRILLADDHTLVVEGFRKLLEPECEIAGVDSDGRTLLTVALQTKPDIVVLDLGLPLLSGMDAGRELKRLMPLISGGGGSFTLPALAAAAASDTNHGGLVITQGAAAAGDEILRVDDSEGNTVFSVTPDGRCILLSNGARQEASLILSDNTPGNAGQLAFDTFSGVNRSPEWRALQEVTSW